MHWNILQAAVSRVGTLCGTSWNRRNGHDGPGEREADTMRTSACFILAGLLALCAAPPTQAIAANVADLKGIWRLHGEEGTASLERDGRGGRVSRHASGAEESDGTMTASPAFNAAPPAFLKHADSLWRKNRVR